MAAGPDLTLDDRVPRTGHGEPATTAAGAAGGVADASATKVQAERNLVLMFGGGVNEIQRELIAAAGLRLPRVPR